MDRETAKWEKSKKRTGEEGKEKKYNEHTRRRIQPRMFWQMHMTPFCQKSMYREVYVGGRVRTRG